MKHLHLQAIVFLLGMLTGLLIDAFAPRQYALALVATVLALAVLVVTRWRLIYRFERAWIKQKQRRQLRPVPVARKAK